MPKAVQFTRNGGVDVLDVVEVDQPAPGPAEVVVAVVASAINPGEIAIREGNFGESTFPSGQGSDLAGRISATGAAVTDWQVGDEVIGWSDERAAQAEFVVVPASRLTRRPPEVPWDQAGSLYVAGGTAVAMVQALDVVPGRTVVVTGASGGVGSILIQLLRRDGTHVVGVAGAGNADWLRSLGVIPVAHGDGLDERLLAAAPDGIDAVFDTYGNGYVDQFIGLGVPAERIVTIFDFEAAQRVGARVVYGHEIASAALLGELAGLIATGELSVPIASTYSLDEVRAAYSQLAERHARGKIVLRIAP